MRETIRNSKASNPDIKLSTHSQPADLSSPLVTPTMQDDDPNIADGYGAGSHATYPRDET